MLAPITPSRPQVHGHRGCRGLRPENTLPAFLHAIELGVDVIELDVVVSHDQQIVVAHDPWLPAALGTGPAGELIDPRQEQAYNLYQLPYASIRQCALGRWPDPRFPEQVAVPTHRPLLREVLLAGQRACQRLQRSAVEYSVEIKSGVESDGAYHPAPAQFAQLVLTELHLCGVAAWTTILSFDRRGLQAVRRMQPTQRLCLLLENEALASDLFCQLGFVPEVLGPDFRLLSRPLVQQLKNAYPLLHLVPWTVNEFCELQEVLSWHPTGITTDYPDRMLALLKQNL